MNKLNGIDHNNISFKNAALITPAMNFLQSSEIIGATAVDLGSMVIPRTVIDTKRNPQAGIETFAREIVGVFVHGSIGLFGFGAAYLLSLGLKKYKDVDFKNINADNKTIDAMSKIFHEICKTNSQSSKQVIAKKFLENIFENVDNLSTNKKRIVDSLHSSIFKGKNYKNLKENLIARVVCDTGSAKHVTVKLGEETLKTEARYLIDDAYSLTKAFTRNKVFNLFKSSTHGEFIKDLKNLGIGKTIIGLAVIASIGSTVQAINRYMTKKRTGQGGFVGDPNYEANLKADKPKDKPENKAQKPKNWGFKALKTGAAILWAGFVIKSIGTSEFLSKIQFRSKLPTLAQLKLVYGSAILGRLLASNDKNELRETATRDFLGFTNWLILGGVAAKFIAHKIRPSLFGSQIKEKGLAFWKKLISTPMKTQEDVIFHELKGTAFKENIKLSTSTTLKLLRKRAEKELRALNAIKDLKALNIAQLGGYAYSCLMLGIFIPSLNKYITNRSKKKIEPNNTIINNNRFNNLITFDSRVKQIYTKFLRHNNSDAAQK